ncbi:hypothetical protein UNSW1_810 [Campylobacter concisus UNSW1]|nr:hypothetical protein UNSW1_810 [Campylobacter concisus UNSW1]
MSKFAKKCKFTRLLVINILVFAVFCQAHLFLQTARITPLMRKIPANFSNVFSL